MEFQAKVLLLDKRFGHKDRILQEFEKAGLNKPEFFLAGEGQLLEEEYYDYIDQVPPPRSGYRAWVERPNSWNAFQCFRKMIGQAQKDELESIALCEDDVGLQPNFQEVLKKAEEELAALPAWDMLYLCANHTFKPTKQLSEHVLKLNGSGGFQFVLLRSHMYKVILDLPVEDPIDGMVGKKIHPSYNCYAIWPNIAIPLGGYSYCEGYDYDGATMYLNKGC
jgi:hypothetical protein